jgi:hypothetical protein
LIPTKIPHIHRPSYLCIAMKRSAVAILAIIYLAISSGVVVNIHYCMGKMSSVKLQAWAPNTCACGKKMESKKGCCKTELKVLKVQDAQKIAYADYAFQLPVTTIVTELNLLQTPFYNNASAILPNGHSPPILSGPDPYLRNCVFRI